MSRLQKTVSYGGEPLRNIALCLSCPLPDCVDCLAPGRAGLPRLVTRDTRTKYGAFAARLVRLGLASTAEIAAELDVSERTVRRWVKLI